MVVRHVPLDSQDGAPLLLDLDIGVCPEDHVRPRADSIGSGKPGTGQRERGRNSRLGTRGCRKTASRSGSLPPLEPVQPSVSNMAVPRLSLEPMENIPTSPGSIRRSDSWMSMGSCRRVNATPRLPPIGASDHVQTFLPSCSPAKPSPRDLDPDTTGIDPVLYDNEDKTDVRLLGRRRNAVVTSVPNGTTADNPS